MNNADILTSPVRVNARSGTVYYFNGYVSVEIVSGTEEQQRAVLALVAQAQRMAQLLQRIDRSAGFDASSTAFQAEVKAVLRAARVMSGGSLQSEGA